MRALPGFGLAEYGQLLASLRDAGWTLSPVSALTEDADDRVYLRHDVDFSLIDALPMARTEAAQHVSATYYVLLSGPYNVLAADNRRALRELIKLGHELGLHYDLATYPKDEAGARARLAWEAEILEEQAGVPVRTACLHQPSLTGADPFRTGPLLNPHDPAHADGLVYVSDSCRRWRDATLLDCLGPARPRRLMLNTHPELWLDGSVGDPMTYLETVLLDCLVRPANAYVRDVVRNLWATATSRS